MSGFIVKGRTTEFVVAEGSKIDLFLLLLYTRHVYNLTNCWSKAQKFDFQNPSMPGKNEY